MARLKKHTCEYERALRAHVHNVRRFLGFLDLEMKKPSSQGRGSRIADASNALELINDQIRYEKLGIDFRKDRPLTIAEINGEENGK